MRSSRWLLLPMLFAAGCMKSEVIQPGHPAPAALYTTTKKASEAGNAGRIPRIDTVLSAAHVLEKNGDAARDPADRSMRYQKARMTYEQALSLDPASRAAQAGVARVYSKEGNQAKAIELFKAAIEASPADPELWHDLSMCFARQRQWDESIACMQRAAQINPANLNYSNNYGWLLARAGRYQESFDHFCRTLGEARAHYNLARMADHLGNRELCKQYLEAALRVDPQLPEARQMLASLNTDEQGIRAARFEQ
jgi:Tfp pilus assembly protein PilF